jgi:hypothetical protein
VIGRLPVHIVSQSLAVKILFLKIYSVKLKVGWILKRPPVSCRAGVKRNVMETLAGRMRPILTIYSEKLQGEF